MVKSLEEALGLVNVRRHALAAQKFANAPPLGLTYWAKLMHNLDNENIPGNEMTYVII